MYHAIVKRRVLGLFEQANRGNWQAIVDELAPTFSYRFVGDTPLGGTRTTHEAMQRWFERLYRLFPGAQFVPDTIVVNGPPWSTTIMTYMHIRGTAPLGPNGELVPYENEFAQKTKLRWGRVVSITTLEDTQRFASILPALAAAGIADATKPPITDAPITDAPGRSGVAVA